MTARPRGAVVSGVPPVVVLALLLAPAILVTTALAPVRVAAQIPMPSGLIASYETKLSYGTRETSTTGEDERIFENWLDLGYMHDALVAGARLVAFQPPDPTIYPGAPGEDNSSAGIDLAYAEYSTSHVTLRGGNFYTLFGRGMTLRLYEDRPLRVDTNALGGTGTFYLPDGQIVALAGATVEGNAEDAGRGRTEPIYALDVEHGVWSPVSLRLGGSLATTDLTAGRDGRREPLRMKGVRASATVAMVDLVAEYARVDGPNVLGADRLGFDGPNFHGTGVYGAACTVVGGVGLVFEFKDYDALLFRNDADIDLNVPPAVMRDHTFNLLNRHPHQLDTGDERGAQLEVSYVTDRLLGQGSTSLVANVSRTRNHEQKQQGNYFDDAYFEIQQELGSKLSLTGALSRQKSLASIETPDPLRTLWTPIAAMNWRLNDVHALHVQFEHQHDRSQAFGEFDVDFFILELTRSPDLTMGIMVEQTNKSEEQLRRLGESDTSFLAATLDYNLFGVHELRLFYGARNAGFVCVGGVCRFEPAFDGFEMSLVSRF